jgi:hypothetical protein
MTLILKQTQRVIFKRKINLSRVNHRHNIQVQIQNKFNHISHPRFSLTLLNNNSRILNLRISNSRILNLRFNRTLNNSNNSQSSLHTINSHSITANQIRRGFTIQISKLNGETYDSMTNCRIAILLQPIMYITKTSTKTSIHHSNLITNVLRLTLNEENIKSSKM